MYGTKLAEGCNSNQLVVSKKHLTWFICFTSLHYLCTQIYYYYHTHTHTQDCCSELEAVGAGAPHVQERQEKEEQIDRDVPRTVFNIDSQTYGVAYGRDVQANVREKLVGSTQCTIGHAV